MKSHMSLVVLVTVFSAIAVLAERTLDAQPRGRGAGADASSERSGDRDAEKEQIKPYAEVITDEAKSSRGLFTTHWVGDKLYYEIPSDQLDKDMLWVATLEKTQSGYSYGGMPVGDRVVRWELRGEQVLLRDVKYSIRTHDDDPAISMAVADTSVSPIIKAFPVKAWGTDKKPVIDVTELFTTDVTEFSPKQALEASGLDSKRSFLERVKCFPENIEVEALVTYNLSTSRESSAETPRRRGPTRGPRRDPTQSSVTVVVHHSMLRLPEQKMAPRQFDQRVGFFTVRFEDYGADENHAVESVRYITRWRLEKKDPDAEISEPVKPIVFYVGRGVPEKWKAYVKKGIEMWQPAFEAAGFKNAIIAKLAPSEAEDPDWDPEDARISTIRWLPSTTENAFGPHVHDPRTGEILEADVRMYHNVLKLVRDWYFVQASPNDPRAQKLPLPDDVVGELLAYVVAHEVGHSLGFPHNMKASSSFSVENLRDPEFTRKYGTEASIMDYGRFNYVAQPGDGAALIPTIGPYDVFAVQWGYGQYQNAEEEKQGLAALVAQQKDNPMLRFGDADPSEDPSRQTEDLGSDPLMATELGMKNIDRVADYLVQACCQPGEDYELLENMYTQLIRQRTRELMHVTAMVGGFEEINLYFGDADKRYHPLDGQRQKQAVGFLIEHALKTNPKLVDPDITMRLETSGAATRILESQQSILQALINTNRVQRMAEHVQRNQSENVQDLYTPLALLEDLRSGIWSELENDKVEIDLYRRNLQRAHIALLGSKLKDTSDQSDLPALSRSQLRLIREICQSKLNSAAARYTSTFPVNTAAYAGIITRAHLEEVIADIDAALDPKVQAEVTVTPESAPRVPRD